MGNLQQTLHNKNNRKIIDNKYYIISYPNLVHELIEDSLEVDGLVIFIIWERGRKQDKWSKVESVSVEFVLLSHADSLK